jgi:hypothetical protein
MHLHNSTALRKCYGVLCCAMLCYAMLCYGNVLSNWGHYFLVLYICIL